VAIYSSDVVHHCDAEGMRISDSTLNDVQSQSCPKIRFLHLPPRRLPKDFNAAIL
jgi:hypothetical protein